MALIDYPNRLSLLLLGGVLLIALAYGYFSYQAPLPNTFFTAEGSDYHFPYRLSQPDQVIELPNKLREISGLASWSDDEVLCIQDEDGEVFIFNLREEKVTKDFRFGKDRDYEGIARRDSQIYVLERDGDLHYFNYDPERSSFDAEKLETSFSYRNDLEGLCYDPQQAAFLLVPKAQNLHPSSATNHLRDIYRYWPDSSDIEQEPLYQIDEYALGQLIYGQRQRFTFRPSSIAIHPQTGQLFLLSAVGESLLVLNAQGEVEYLELLDRSIFPQPEGLTFTSEGGLIISSEGQSRQAIIATFQPYNPTSSSLDSLGYHE
ncbi:MAG: SdiA-regulated domain-containing protein [Bacteroidota bacterium]